ncbi:Precorrin-4 C(11)-methyltransferase [gamma proteobacterium HdN1]|nr:Precorrin-4 C(11)-methyltransferase [gamma proteobacterium HdN1]
MKVHFIGAGPGAADLITVRGRDLLARCPVCLYAGSIVPEELLAYCGEGTRKVNTAPLSLDEIKVEFLRAQGEGHDIARLHSGDLSVWSAVAEQIRRLEALGIEYTMTPGVPAFAAAAAALGRELTIPEVAQSLVLTRVSGRASAMPETESLENFGKTGTTLAIHLAIHRLDEIVARLLPLYGEDCPVAIVVRASWPNQRVVRATLATIKPRFATEKRVTNDPIERTAIIFVGRSLAAEGFRDSALYNAGYDRRFRPGSTI